ncbi:hypothetical protein [Flavobacterium sp.]|uniref:hypothetical protein n=1 Tax=Flavobacterium sp. TaxID=239 RepID=UPI0012133570|nr:hypothetical protein [Flavobacterium sp.]RZJ70058.1 MAG: hypothetical protein EOO49_15510 [Flavobacterium sp.]
METNDYTKMIRKIASREAFIATGIALTIDCIILIVATLTDDSMFAIESRTLWIPIIFAIALLVFGQLLAKRTAVLISRKPHIWWLAGPICAAVTLFIAVSICSSLFFINEAIVNFNIDLFWMDLAVFTLGIPAGILIYSSPFLLAHGLWFGYRISNRIKNLHVEV